MIMRVGRWSVVGCVGCLVASAVVAAVLGSIMPKNLRAETKPQPDAELERAREQVKMLDDLYKNAVVSITKRYVEKQDNNPAIMVAKEVFAAMKKQGWHSARLVDATGDPLNAENAPKTDFEKAAFKEIGSGKPYYEQVVGEGKDRRLLAATVVPVVMQKCAECHTGKKMGDVLGFLRYDLPVK